MKKPIEVEPLMIEAGSTKVLINGNTPFVRCRVISEDNYATLYNKALLWDNYKPEEARPKIDTTTITLY